MAGDEPLPGGSFQPLGRHQLKDVPSASQLFQLAAPGLRDDFPPLKTLSATSLPALHHRLVGRADALARVEALLEPAETRLVTITGPGGAGKSRLALEVAARAALDRPVHHVGLAPVSDAELIPSAIARAIGAREWNARSATEAVADTLNGMGALLFLDNLEHLPTAAVHVAALLDLAPDVQVLATSRTPLRLSTEHVLPLGPLSIDDATTLFLELAAARGVNLHDDALASVHEICRRLDGLPLAIELVAARLAVLPPAEILRALGEGLALEMEGPVDLPERQRTLRAAIDWSYQRLSESTRAARVLAIFADSASLDDARAVAAAGRGSIGSRALVGWSLIRSESADGELPPVDAGDGREHALENLQALDVLEELGPLRPLPESSRYPRSSGSRGRTIRRGSIDSARVRQHQRGTRRLISSGRIRIRFARSRLSSGSGAAMPTSARRGAGSLWALASPIRCRPMRAAALRTAARRAAAQSDWEAAEPMLEQARDLYRSAGLTREECSCSGTSASWR
jgi:hypothetical protein